MSSCHERILSAALPNVVFDGWTDGALERAAISAGLTAFDAKRTFPGGVIDALDHLARRTDEQMLAILARDYDMPKLKIRERIATAVMVRLRLMLPYREAIRRAMAFYAMPWHTAEGLRVLYRTMDHMWAAAGDTSTDYNFYTKRLTLSQVYMSTLTVWLDDAEDLKKTEAFLHRRIENVMQFEKFKAKAKEKFSALMPQG